MTDTTHEPRGPEIDDEEEQLLARLRAGDRSAFEDLVAPHVAVARSLAVRMLGNLDDSEDAVQDAMLKAYRGLDSFRGGFRAWFLRIVYHQSVDATRRRSTRKGHESRAAVSPEASTQTAGAIEQRETLARVRAAIDTLPARQRAALHLRVVEGLAYRAIAEVLGITPGSARVYVVRARSILRDRVGGEVPE